MSSNVIPLANRAVTPRPVREPSGTPATVTPITSPTAVYTVAQVAHLLSLSLGSTYALIRAEDIPAKKMGGRWVIPKRRFHTWLDDLPEATTEDIDRELQQLDRPS